MFFFFSSSTASALGMSTTLYGRMFFFFSPSTASALGMSTPPGTTVTIFRDTSTPVSVCITHMAFPPSTPSALGMSTAGHLSVSMFTLLQIFFFLLIMNIQRVLHNLFFLIMIIQSITIRVSDDIHRGIYCWSVCRDHRGQYGRSYSQQGCSWHRAV